MNAICSFAGYDYYASETKCRQGTYCRSKSPTSKRSQDNDYNGMKLNGKLRK